MAGSLLLPGRNAFAEPDPRTASVVAGTIAVDMHSHIRIRVPVSSNFGPSNPAPEPDVDLAGEIQRAGFSAVCQTWNVDEPGDDYAYAQKALDYEDRLLARNHMRRALTMRDLQAAHDAKQPIIIQTAEGTQFLQGRLARLEEFRARGLRHVQLLHERDDAVAPLGDVYTAPVHLGGLTPFGGDVIRECNRLGLLVDMAHGTAETVAGALRATRQPFIISHGGLSRDAAGKTITPDIQRRLLGDDIARAVGDAGGVIGVWWRLFNSVSDYVTGIRNRVAAFGVDHVGIGTDTNLMERYILPHTNQIWPDQKTGFFYAVADEMLRQGFSPGDIAKIGGGNFCRVFAQAVRD